MLVIDRAETRFAMVRNFVDRLARESDHQAGPRVRLLLLARSRGEWFEGLKSNEVWDLIAGSGPLGEGLCISTPLADRQRIYQSALGRFGAWMERASPPSSSDPGVAGDAAGGGAGCLERSPRRNIG
ncbi:MAG: hypothetical protein HY815_31335 [Candidatus Riflebacteria bacterium]|nr:hypothetical protein [Candidatus Riflebacteria bacterium]